MTDVVVTVAKSLWRGWVEEGALPGIAWDGNSEYHFWIGQFPKIEPGERVYVVAFNRLRGYSPLVRLSGDGSPPFYRRSMVRHADAVAVTIPEPIRGFQGWRYRFWPREIEVPFPNWQTP